LLSTNFADVIYGRYSDYWTLVLIMTETADPGAVVDALRAMDARRIGIDGSNGSGKSTLARYVAEQLRHRLFSLDDYLERNRGGFLEFIDYPRLQAEVSTESVYVIEGVCLLTALERAELATDALVYVKRRHLGLWADEDELEVSEPLEEFLANERKLTAMVSREPEEAAELGLAEEVIRYHYLTRPHHKADVVYFRDEH
jgi:hypothetical protein